MKRIEIYHKKAKEFFNKIGLEKTSSDFTGIVMSRIQAEAVSEKNRLLPSVPYYLIAMFFAAGILMLPFNTYILNFINDLMIKVSDIDYTFINDFLITLTDTIKDYSVSSTVLITLGLSTILFCTMIFINYPSYSYKTVKVKIS